MDNATPPAPPPLPPPKPEQRGQSLALKTRKGTPSWDAEDRREDGSKQPLEPPVGMYFFYGSLGDPGLLAEILSLPSEPILRPAYVVGYTVKLWGQYPALIQGQPGEIVEGNVFYVANKAAAARLAEYETRNYKPVPCRVHFRDGGETELIEGFTFMFHGRRSELSEGKFDLDSWLKQIRRK